MNFDFLRVFKTNLNKIRIGSDGDGGYVIADGLSYDVLISGGISNNIEFEEDFLKKHNGIDCFAYDGTINDLPNKNSRILFTKKNISGHNDENFTNLSETIDKYNDIFLKLDIEAYEFNWLESISESQLKKIKQIVIEFHYPFSDWIFFDNTDALPVDSKLNILKKITNTHKIIHINPNNTCGATNLDGIEFPNVFECTLIRKDICNITELNDEVIPNRLDRENSVSFPTINLNYYPFMKKNTDSIVIIDCFVSNEIVESKLIDQIERIKKLNLDILLISNTNVKENIIKSVNYFIYDNRNQLFESQYTNVYDIDFIDYIYLGDEYQFTLHKISPGLQRHGLSVLVNLFNSVNFVKSLGYKNFWRIEVDDLFGKESLISFSESPLTLKNENKKAILYYNSDNISFHYMFWNIDYFLEKIPQVKNEEDYKSILLTNFGTLDFVVVEEFIWRFLTKKGDDDVLIRDGGNMNLDFPDTIWNTNASLSNIDPKFDDCWTAIFKINNKSGLFLFTKNLSSSSKSRRIITYSQNGVEEINHFLPGFNSWAWNIVNENVYKFEVYEEDRLLYVEECSEIKNYVELP